MAEEPSPTATEVTSPPYSAQESNSSNPHQHVVSPLPTSDKKVVFTVDTYRDWIRIELYALNGPGNVLFFLGPAEQIPDNPSNWITSPLFAGAYALYADEPRAGQQRPKIPICGTVHLTECLIRQGCGGPTGEEPVRYLKDNLHWRCYRAGIRKFLWKRFRV
jgi:hypothetical protein